jgi:hypothetical protein
MSAPVVELRCHGCAFEGFLRHRLLALRYALPDGAFVDGNPEFGWCEQCGGVADIEEPLDIESIENKKRTLLQSQRPRNILAAIGRIFGNSAGDESWRVQRLNALFRVAKLRASPPRCLACGGTNVAPLSFDSDGNCISLVHDCGGTLYRLPTDPDAPRYSYKPEFITLDVEGNRLTSSAHPFWGKL